MQHLKTGETAEVLLLFVGVELNTVRATCLNLYAAI
jgi:hypothetical protein